MLHHTDYNLHPHHHHQASSDSNNCTISFANSPPLNHTVYSVHNNVGGQSSTGLYTGVVGHNPNVHGLNPSYGTAGSGFAGVLDNPAVVSVLNNPYQNGSNVGSSNLMVANSSTSMVIRNQPAPDSSPSALVPRRNDKAYR